MGGAISGTLPAGVYVATSTLIVPVGQTLNLQPGVVLKLADNTSMIVLGTLLSSGTVENPIYITSLADDSVGGDSGNDGPTTGMPGSWQFLSFFQSTGSALAWTTVRFSQYINLSASSPQFTNVTISSMALSAMLADLVSSPTGSNNRAFGSPWNAIDHAPGILTSQVAWNDIGIPHLLRTQRIRVNAGGRLTFNPGTVMKFGNAALAAVDGGEIVLAGTLNQPVVLTSIQDDLFEGDTEGNGQLPLIPGLWGGVQFIRAGPASRVDRAVFRYGGGFAPYISYELQDVIGYVPPVSVMGSSLAINSVQSMMSGSSALSISHGSSATVTGLGISGSGTGFSVGVLVNNSRANLWGGFIVNNAQAGILAYSGQVNVRDLFLQLNAAGLSGQQGSNFQVLQTTFTFNPIPIQLSLDTEFNFSELSIYNNSLNGVQIFPGIITRPMVWNSLSVPYLLRNGSFQINAGGRLSLNPGVLIKGQDAGLIVAEGGVLSINGTSANPVRMTSLADDSLGGDTEGNGQVAPPYPMAMNITLNRSGAGTRIDYASMRYAAVTLLGSTVTVTGVQISSGIYTTFDLQQGSSLTIDNSLIADKSQNNGIQVRQNSALLMRNSQVRRMSEGVTGNVGRIVIENSLLDFNLVAIDVTSGSVLSVIGSTLTDNNYSTIRSDASSATIRQTYFARTRLSSVSSTWPRMDAAYNYWGSPTGPSARGNPDGRGDHVSEGVQYMPFYSVPWTDLVAVDDVRPPRTQLAVGNPYTVSSFGLHVTTYTPLGRNAVDDRVRFDDQQGVGIAETRFRLNNGSFTVVSGTFSLVVPGSHTYQIYSADFSGNQEEPFDRWIYVDALAPVTQVVFTPGAISDTSNRTLISTQTLISFSASDDFTGASSTHYRVDASTDLIYSNPFRLTLGTHTLQFFSLDVLGNRESLQTRELSVVDPSSMTTRLILGTPVYTSTSNVVYISTQTPISFMVQPGSVPVALTRYTLDAAPISTYTAPFTLFAGTHTIVYQSIDTLGTVEPLQSAQLTVDNSAPQFQLVFAPEAIFRSGQIFASTGTQVGILAEDRVSGVGSVEYRLEESSGAFQIFTGTLTLSAGTHQLRIRASDHVNLVRSAGPMTVIVSTGPPADNSFPTTGNLPDGTTIYSSPEPIIIIPPGGGSASPTAPPVVQSVNISPTPPLGLGPVTFTVHFSKPMDNTVAPNVRLVGVSGVIIMPVLEQSYVGNTWIGRVDIIPALPTGNALLSISGARDAQGNTVIPSLLLVPIQYTLPSPPGTLTAQFNGTSGRLDLTWLAGANETAGGSYTLYRSTESPVFLAPLATGLTARTFSDLPPGDVPAAYYAVTRVDSAGISSRLGNILNISMPLPPVITSPAAGAQVDASSIVISGIAQVGSLIDVSTGPTGSTLFTAIVGSSGTWSAPLNLGVGSFLIKAQTRSSVTAQVSSATLVTITTIVLPHPPVDFAATPADTRITLSWTPSTETNLRGYNIYRNGNTRPLNVSPLPVVQSSYIDLALTNGRSYSYVIKSVRNDGLESGASTTQTTTPMSSNGW